MAKAPTARVVPEDGDAFDAPFANLAPSSLFVLTESPLAFKQALSLQIGEISLHGEVAFTCLAPPGAVVVFRPTPEALEALEDLMEAVPVVVGGSEGTSLEDFQAMSDADLDALPEGDPEGPTNTEGEPLDVDEEGEDPSKDAAKEVREAFQRSKLPPNLATERVGSEALANKSAALSRRPGDRDPTVIPETLDADADPDDATESGRGGRAASYGPDENTVVPRPGPDQDRRPD